MGAGQEAIHASCGALACLPPATTAVLDILAAIVGILISKTVISNRPQACYYDPVGDRTDPRTAGQWVRYIVVAVIALFLVWWMLRVYVL